MKRKRRHLSAEFKARVAKEALREEKSIQDIAQENEIAPSQVSAWKKELEERMGELFERKNGVNETAKREEKRAERAERLERKVGQLVIEKEFLEKKCEQLGIDLSERP
ncbi:transposase [Roseibacillus persicicus]